MRAVHIFPVALHPDISFQFNNVLVVIQLMPFVTSVVSRPILPFVGLLLPMQDAIPNIVAMLRVTVRYQCFRLDAY